jgi:hypothetical protein
VGGSYGLIAAISGLVRIMFMARVHIISQIDAVPTGIYSTDGLGAETTQAYSTYLHETVHWWQHIGSSAWCTPRKPIKSNRQEAPTSR